MFTEDVREELASVMPAKPCCRRALLSALVRSAGAFHLHGRGQVHVEMELAAGPAARRAVELLRAAGASCDILTHREPRFGGSQRVEIVCGSDPASLAALREAGVLTSRNTPMGRPPQRVVGRSCCRRSYLRGAFIASGSVSAPRRPVHLELRAHDEAAAADLAALARAEGLELRVRDRAAFAMAYAKRLETVEDFLTVVGAPQAAIRLAEGEVVSQARGGANRQANAETANLRRQVVAARVQLQAIATLRDGGRFERLDAPLVEAAMLREEHPELPLGELAAIADPPLPKATLAARLRALVHLADEGAAVPEAKL
jgi:DNA-binding protein WhiA